MARYVHETHLSDALGRVVRSEYEHGYVAWSRIEAYIRKNWPTAAGREGATEKLYRLTVELTGLSRRRRAGGLHNAGRFG